MIAASKEIFEKRPELAQLIAVEDGQMFLNDDSGNVHSHCKEHQLEKWVINREEALSETAAPVEPAIPEDPTTKEINPDNNPEYSPTAAQYGKTDAGKTEGKAKAGNTGKKK